MTNHTSKKVINFIDTQQTELKAILKKVQVLDTIQKKLTPYLDPNIQKYCHVGNISGNQLVLIAANGSVATQLRFQKHDLLIQLKKNPDLAFIKDIHCKVDPAFRIMPARMMPSKQRKMPALSFETATIVHEMAASLSDPKLKTIMDTIASHIAENRNRS